jgi:hypothetical protein
VANNRKGSAVGCAGLGCLGLGVVLLGFCGSLQDSPSSPSSPLLSAGSYETTKAPTASPPSETFYIHGAVNVRSGPGKEHPVIRTLARGAAVQLGPADANGWAELYAFGGAREGYIYRKSDNVRSTPPPDDDSTESSASSDSRSTSDHAESSGRSRAGSRYIRGPRGGCYEYTASGRKNYVPRSYCN